MERVYWHCWMMQQVCWYCRIMSVCSTSGWFLISDFEEAELIGPVAHTGIEFMSPLKDGFMESHGKSLTNNMSLRVWFPHLGVGCVKAHPGRSS
jgi:hypothetical protein